MDAVVAVMLGPHGHHVFLVERMDHEQHAKPPMRADYATIAVVRHRVRAEVAAPVTGAGDDPVIARVNWRGRTTIAERCMHIFSYLKAVFVLLLTFVLTALFNAHALWRSDARVP